MAGRNPIPKALKLIHGKKRINYDEPSPPPGFPSMPEWLRAFPIAVDEWIREADILSVMGVLTVADAGELANRCYLSSQIQDLAMQIKENPEIGYTQINNLITNYRNFGSLLGLNPASRSKLTMAKPKEESSLESFRNRKNVKKN